MQGNSDNKKITLKTKENNEIEFKTDPSVHDLIMGLLQHKLGKESSNYGTEVTHSSDYIMRLDPDTMEIKFISKEELINGKADLEELTHPYFNNLKKKNISKSNGNKNIEILKLEKEDKILLFSPHPDDEILGACGLLYKSLSEKIDVKVIYMTSGKTAGGAETRQIEATNGIKLLGGTEENLIFTTFPFYDRKERNLELDDYEYARELLRTYLPTKVFICADIFDPNRTHKKCFDILTEVIKEEEFQKINAFFYYSVWYWPEENEFSHILPYDYVAYKMKIYAMLEHKSQIETKFMGSDPRPFYQRATARSSRLFILFICDFRMDIFLCLVIQFLRPGD